MPPSPPTASAQQPAPSLKQPTPESAHRRKTVRFDQGGENTPGEAVQLKCSPGKAAAASASRLLDDGHVLLFSPGPVRQDSWTIEAQRPNRMAESSPAPATACAEASPSPSLSCLSGGTGGTFTPASAGYLESARKVDDLRGRLESLEASLKEMESKAVAHLDKSLQDKVLATAAKIVQKRFLQDKDLDRRLQHSILQTAIKVVNKREAAATAATAAAAGAGGVAPQQQQQQAALPEQAQQAQQEGDPTRKLTFEQGEPSSSSSGAAPTAPVAEQVQAYVAHIEQGFGEVLRRLEKKVDSVASLLDQNVLELLESRMAGGLLKMESRLAAVEEAAAASSLTPAQQPAAQGASFRLLDRVTAVEAAMAEQSRAVTDLLAALGAQGSAASQRLADAVAAAQASTAAPTPAAPASSPAKAAAAAAAGGEQLLAAAVDKPAELSPAGKPAAATAAAAAEVEAPVAAEEQEQAQPAAAQLVQRKAAVARRSVLGDPRRTAASSSGPAAGGSQRKVLTPRLQALHSAGTAQKIAMATARQQLVLSAAKAKEVAEAEAPVWVTMFHVFGWGTLVLVGLAAVLMGTVAALLKGGQLTEADLAFLWEAPRK